MSITPSRPLFFSSPSTVMVTVGYTGVILTCIATAWPLPLTVGWVSSAMNLSSLSTRILDTRFVLTTLRFDSGFKITDVGSYTCVVMGESTSQSRTVKLVHTIRTVTTERIECQVNTDKLFYQIRVLNTSCNTWSRSLMRLTESNLRDTVTSAITSQCGNCDPSSTAVVVTNQTACSNSVNRAALFRGTITSTTIAQAKLFFCEFQEWQQTGPAIYLTSNDPLLFHVDRECTLKSESLTGSECSVGTSNNSALLAFSSGVVLFVIIVVLSSIAGTIGSRIHKRY